MSDIVDRLKAAGKPMALDDRVWNTITVSSGASIFDEAASTITALQERVKELEGALKPFAVLARLFDEDMISGNMPARGSIYEWSRLIDGQEVNYTLTVEHLKSARTALGEKQ